MTSIEDDASTNAGTAPEAEVGPVALRGISSFSSQELEWCVQGYCQLGSAVGVRRAYPFPAQTQTEWIQDVFKRIRKIQKTEGIAPDDPEMLKILCNFRTTRWTKEAVEALRAAVLKYGRRWWVIWDQAEGTLLAPFSRDQLYCKWKSLRARPKPPRLYHLLDVTDKDGKPYSFRALGPTEAAKEAAKLGYELLRLREDGHDHEATVFKVDAFEPEPSVTKIVFEREFNFDWIESEPPKRRKPSAPVQEPLTAAPIERAANDVQEFENVSAASADRSADKTAAPFQEPENAISKLTAADKSASAPEKASTTVSFAAIRKRLRNELRALKAITPSDDDERRRLKKQKADFRRKLEEYQDPKPIIAI